MHRVYQIITIRRGTNRQQRVIDYLEKLPDSSYCLASRDIKSQIVVGKYNARLE